MGKTIDHRLPLWPRLNGCLEDGRVEIDNNPVENAIRSAAAVGKKNSLFMGEAEAGQRHPVHDHRSLPPAVAIDPQTYLRDVPTLLIGRSRPSQWKPGSRPDRQPFNAKP